MGIGTPCNLCSWKAIKNRYKGRVVLREISPDDPMSFTLLFGAPGWVAVLHAGKPAEKELARFASIPNVCCCDE